jgi:hypothetical protein
MHKCGYLIAWVIDHEGTHVVASWSHGGTRPVGCCGNMLCPARCVMCRIGVTAVISPFLLGHIISSLLGGE